MYGLALEHNANNALHNNDVNPPQNHKHMSQVQFFSYCLHTQQNQFAIIQSKGHLFQQYLCDIWVSMDQNHL